MADRSGGHSWVCSRSMALMRGDFSSDTISADNDARVEWSAATAIEDPASAKLCQRHEDAAVSMLFCHSGYTTCSTRRGKSAVMFW